MKIIKYTKEAILPDFERVTIEVEIGKSTYNYSRIMAINCDNDLRAEVLANQIGTIISRELLLKIKSTPLN